jgi:5-methyltetrahydrofolate--homocysteine methyltransferase
MFTLLKFLDLLKEKIVVFDGAMGTNLMAQNLTLEDFGGANFENCSENLLYTRPDAVLKKFIGFSRSRARRDRNEHFRRQHVVLQEFGIADKAYDVNFRAAQMAKNWRMIFRPKKNRVLSPVRWDRERNCRRSDIFLISI